VVFPASSGQSSNNTPTEKMLYSFLKPKTTIFRNTSIDSIIISDIGKKGACLTVFENNVQEIFFHLMLLPNINDKLSSLASLTLTDETNKLVRNRTQDILCDYELTMIFCLLFLRLVKVF